MTTQEEICALAGTFADEEADEALRRCCIAAEMELCGRLKKGVTAESCRNALIPAAAWLALSYLATVRQMDGMEDFSVADLSVRRGSLQPEKALRIQAEALMAPYFEDTFCFRGVRT